MGHVFSWIIRSIKKILVKFIFKRTFLYICPICPWCLCLVSKLIVFAAKHSFAKRFPPFGTFTFLLFPLISHVFFFRFPVHPFSEQMQPNRTTRNRAQSKIIAQTQSICTPACSACILIIALDSLSHTTPRHETEERKNRRTSLHSHTWDTNEDAKNLFWHRAVALFSSRHLWGFLKRAWGLRMFTLWHFAWQSRREMDKF